MKTIILAAAAFALFAAGGSGSANGQASHSSSAIWDQQPPGHGASQTPEDQLRAKDRRKDVVADKLRAEDRIKDADANRLRAKDRAVDAAWVARRAKKRHAHA